MFYSRTKHYTLGVEVYTATPVGFSTSHQTQLSTPEGTWSQRDPARISPSV